VSERPGPPRSGSGTADPRGAREPSVSAASRQPPADPFRSATPRLGSADLEDSNRELAHLLRDRRRRANRLTERGGPPKGCVPLEKFRAARESGPPPSQSQPERGLTPFSEEMPASRIIA